MAAAIILGVVLFLILLISFFTYILVFYSPLQQQNDVYNLPPGEQYEKHYDSMKAMIYKLANMPCEKVSTVSRDGIKLTGKYYHSSDSSPMVICFHGYRGTSIRDFSGGVMSCLAQNLNVLLIDERAHGESGGHTMTFGVKERYDCLDWIDYSIKKFGSDIKIVLLGISMGAATILMASDLDLPDNVKGIIADSPYTSPKEIICCVCRDAKLPVKLIYPFIWLGSRLFGHFSLEDADASQSVKNAKVPILLIHGEDDRFVPCEMSRIIKDANPKMICRHTFPHAGHAISYIEDNQRYNHIVSEFINAVL